MNKTNLKHWSLYVLKLDQGKWYVGVTTQTPEHILVLHKKRAGSNWTRQYKPLAIHYTKDLGAVEVDKAQLYEGRVTRKYMERYGDDNVRCSDLTDADEYVAHTEEKGNRKIVAVVSVLLIVIVYLLIDKFWLSPVAHTIIYK